jgi:drug/metabolite transporter (DMT)-like permease
MTRLKTWQLFAVCVLTWGTTWYAITFQIGQTTPEFGVALRFGLAGGVVLMWCAAKGGALRLGVRDHARLALQGGFMYGLSYLCVYHAEKHLVSGLVAVGYSASPLVSGVGARLLFSTPVSARFLWGGALSLVGVALIFAPEFVRAAQQADQSGILWGALFTLASVLLSSVGSLTASRNRTHGMPFWPSLGWGMLYGALVAALVAVAMGQSFALPVATSWWLSLVYLSLAGSAMTFACFLTLQERIGPGPSGSVGVMTPLLALLVSVVLESYQASLFTMLGAALAVWGNVLVLRQKRTAVRSL